MPRVQLAIAICALVLVPVRAQQTRLTEGQIRSAELEMPMLVKLLELKPGMTVADVGAGFGAWTAQFAKAVGPSGRVYATDIGDTQLEALRDLVTRQGLDNVTVIEGAANSTNLPERCCDAILIRDAYHHLSEPAPVIRSMSTALKAGGRLAVVDFPPRAKSPVPSGVPANRGGHGVPPEVVEREVGEVLMHVRTIRDWSPKSEPNALFLALFQKK